jgi:hypothetical protein
VKIATTTRKRYTQVAARPCQVSGPTPMPPCFFPNQSGVCSRSISGQSVLSGRAIDREGDSQVPRSIASAFPFAGTPDGAQQGNGPSHAPHGTGRVP